MKKFILLLLLMPFFYQAQYVPLKVDAIMQIKANPSKPIDTVYFDNYRYVFSVKGDSTFIRWDIIKSEKLFVDRYKATGVSLFLINMSSLVILPQTNLQKDKYYHLGVGMLIGASSNLIIYKVTHKKWLAFFGGILSAGIIGGLKEAYDSKHGGVASWNDALATTTGGINGSAWITIPIGHTQLVQKHHINP